MKRAGRFKQIEELTTDGYKFGYHDRFGDDFARLHRTVMATSNRRVPLETYPSYSDTRFTDGHAHTVFCEGTPKRDGFGGESILGLEYAYDDRLQQWDYKKHEEAWKHASSTGLPNRSADLYEAYLTAYYGHPVRLEHVLAGVNVSSGYPYVVFGTRKL